MKVDGVDLFEYMYLPTTRCNCRCKHCAPQVYTGKQVELSSKEMIEQYEKSEYLKNNAVSVGGGEPFLKEDLDEFIQYLDQHNIPTVITTNGWFTDRIERLIDKLKDTCTVRFAISIDGPEAMHDEIRGCKGIYQRAVQSAVLLHERGFQVQVNMVVQKDNLDYLDEFDAFFKEKGISVIYIPVVFVTGKDFNFTKADVRKIFRYVDYPRGRKYLLSQGTWLIKNCHASKKSWVIDCNGDVYACWGGYYKDNSKEYLIGNLREKEFDKIFVSDIKESVYSDVICNCQGCLLPCEIERETELFDYSTKLTFDDVAFLADDLSNVSTLNDYSVDEKEWYGFENFNDNKFRWMRQQKVTLYVNVGDKPPQKLKIHYLNGFAPLEGQEGMQVTFVLQGGQNAAELICELGENYAELILPSDLNLKNLVQIDISVNKMWKPSDINSQSTDERLLGIGIFSVELL